MKKSTKLIIVGVVILLFLYSLFLAFSGAQKSIITPPTKGTIAIPVPSGTVPVKDFTQNPVEKIGDTTAIAENTGYHIIYFSKDKTFLITILAQPAQKNRDLAEKDLLNKLQIQETDACKLTVSLTVPSDVDPSLAGQDYGLSFCPGGKPFSLGQ